MQGGGKAVCTSCGMKYSTESLREKFNGLKVSVTGSREDVEQWKQLVKIYVNQQDYSAAEVTIKKILEAVPSDEYANNMYSLLQEWKYLEIVNGTLIKYSGRSKKIVLPEGITDIGNLAFEGSYCQEVVLPKTILSIGPQAFMYSALQTLSIPEGLTHIGMRAFYGSSLSDISIPNSIEEIGAGAFAGCSSLHCFEWPSSITVIPYGTFNQSGLYSIKLPNTVEEIGGDAFRECISLKQVILPKCLKVIEGCAFFGCRALTEIDIPLSCTEIGPNAFKYCDHLYKVSQNVVIKTTGDELSFAETPIIVEARRRETQNEWRNKNKCQYCGGTFKGLFRETCTRCGKQKDY